MKIDPRMNKNELMIAMNPFGRKRLMYNEMPSDGYMEASLGHDILWKNACDFYY